MRNRVLIKRYSQGLLGAVADDREFAAFLERLQEFDRILTSHGDMPRLLMTPFLPKSRKARIVEEILERSDFPEKLSRFLLLLVGNERLELLPEIIAFLPDLWNKSKGITPIEVFSVMPLSDTQKLRLKEKLERIEQGPVALKYRQDPSLLGGLSLRKGNIVYDVSLAGSLEKLQEKITEG